MRDLTAAPAGRRGKWLTLLIWLALLAVLVPVSGRLSDAQTDDPAASLPGNAESTQVLRLQDEFGQNDRTQAMAVYERPGGITDADRAAAAADLPELAGIDGVAGPVAPPVASADGQALRVLIPVERGLEVPVVAAVREVIERGPPGLATHVTGPAGVFADQEKAVEGAEGFLLLAAGAVVIVLLLLIYRSPVLWILPVLSAGAALISASAVVCLLAEEFGLTVDANGAGILNVLVFGVATDYALLVIARYREELHRHADRHDAMAVALRRAGPAIVASAATVALGLLCLSFADVDATADLGPVSLVGVACCLAAMTTLLPALLTVMPRSFFWPAVPRVGAEPRQARFWARVAGLVGARPRLVWAYTAAVLGVLALGLTSLNTHGTSNAGIFVSKPDSIIGEEVAARHFPAGTGTPVEVVGAAPAAAGIGAAIDATEGVASHTSTTAGPHVRFEVVLAVAPDGADADRAVDRLRTAVHQVPGADAKVGGPTAIRLDVARASDHDDRLIMPIVLGVVLLILVFLLRSLVAPLIMAVTVVLSFLASLGVAGFVFTHVFGFEGADPSIPLLAFIFLVALGVDYNIFLMTRVREESARLGTRPGVLRGLTVTGGVITSAGVVLAGTFAAMMVLPLVPAVEMGFIVAFGVLLDTLVVRSLLLPALAYDLGARIWWPSPLAKEPTETPVLQVVP
ncbi:MMPL family transporter [Actinocorallia lasiicapitis]